jgi:carbon storage regulator
MLVLTRKGGEKVLIGDGITITILSTDGGRIRIGIEAPEDVNILRGELVACQAPMSLRETVGSR